MADETTESTSPSPSQDGDMGVVNAFLSATSPYASEPDTTDPAGAEDTAPVNPFEADAESSPAPEQDATATVDGAAEQEKPNDLLAALGELESDERDIMLERFNEWLTSQGQPTEAPIQPEAEAAAETPAPQVQHANIAPVADPFSEDDLMDPASFTQKFSNHMAVMGREVQRNIWDSMIPAVGMIVDTALATVLAQRDNPALSGRENELASIIAKARAASPDASTSELATKAAEALMRDAKTLEVVKKLQARGQKIDGRSGKPQTTPASSGARSGNGQFTSTKPQLSPLAQTIQQMVSLNGR